MRWFSSFAILVYLSLLCSPHAMAVHDSRLSPLADSQLQALNPTLTAALIQKSFNPAADNDDEPPVGLMPASSRSCPSVALSLQPVADCFTVPAIVSAHPARAPPILSSP